MSGSAARSSSVTPSAKAASRASSYSSVALVAAHHTRVPAGRRRVAQPVTGRGRPAVAEDRLADRRHLPADRRGRGSDVEDGLGRQPERRQAGRQGARRRPLAVEAQVRDALEPLPDAGQLDGRGRERRGEFHDEDAGPDGRHRPVPRDRAIGEQADGTQERRGGAIGDHRPGWYLRRAALSCDRHVPTPSARRLMRRSGTSRLARAALVAASAATLVTSILVPSAAAIGPVAAGPVSVDAPAKPSLIRSTATTAGPRSRSRPGSTACASARRSRASRSPSSSRTGPCGSARAASPTSRPRRPCRPTRRSPWRASARRSRPP